MVIREEEESSPTQGQQLNISTNSDDVYVSEEEVFDRQYDLTPINGEEQNAQTASGHFIDPWETLSPSEQEARGNDAFFGNANHMVGPNSSEDTEDTENYQGGGYFSNPPSGASPPNEQQVGTREGSRPTFLSPADIHPNMEQREEDIEQLRLLAGRLNADWGGSDYMAPALARRIRDFQFAQEKRRKKYGDERPWGILGLYEHLSSIRIDVEWAEDVAWRRANGEP